MTVGATSDTDSNSGLCSFEMTYVVADLMMWSWERVQQLKSIMEAQQRRFQFQQHQMKRRRVGTATMSFGGDRDQDDNVGSDPDDAYPHPAITVPSPTHYLNGEPASPTCSWELTDEESRQDPER